jgi:death-on-curing family protein
LSKKQKTLRSIIPDDLFDSEEMLIMAWDEGFDYLTGIDTNIKSKDIKKVCALFSVPTAKEMMKKNYWKKALHKGDTEIEELLISLGFSWNSKTKNIPKGSIKILQKEAVKVRAVIKEMKDAAMTLEKAPRLMPPKLEWRDIGYPPTNKDMRYLTASEIIDIHFQLAKDFAKQKNPIKPAGIRDEDMLASAIFRPKTSFQDTLKYPTIEMSAAALLHSLIHNHPFYNGNKRTALVSMLVMLDENHVMFECSDKELFDKLLDIAKHEITNPSPKDLSDRETLEIATWIHSNSRSIRKGERTMPYRKLKPILVAQGCKIGVKERGKVVILNTVKSGRLRLPIQYKYSLHCKRDSTEISQNTISVLRRALHLDDDHGVDSAAFYETDTAIVEGFIRTYRKTLLRLSKV